MVAGGDVPAHQTQALGHGVQHILAFNLRVLCDGAGAVLVTLGSGSAGTKSTSWAVKSGRVQTVLMAVHGGAVATAGV